MGAINIILPDFIIIGANKSGTTSVAYYLNQHPEIKMSNVKEPMFFTSNPLNKSATIKTASLGNPYYAISLEEYSSLFVEQHSESSVFYGEASTSYLASPQKAAPLIKKLVPSVKIIAILREPASRALSAYKMCFGNGIEHRRFKEIAKCAEKENKILFAHGVKEYIRNGLYSQLIKPYLDIFERSNILFLKYDDLKSDATQFMNKLLEFIGARQLNLDTNKKLNTAENNLKTKIKIDEKDIKKLKAFYRKDISMTQKLTGLNLTNWN